MPSKRLHIPDHLLPHSYHCVGSDSVWQYFRRRCVCENSHSLSAHSWDTGPCALALRALTCQHSLRRFPQKFSYENRTEIWLPFSFHTGIQSCVFPFPKLREKREKKRNVVESNPWICHPTFYSGQTWTVQCGAYTVTSVTAAFVLHS